jgi:hypothetical protein
MNPAPPSLSAAERGLFLSSARSALKGLWPSATTASTAGESVLGQLWDLAVECGWFELGGAGDLPSAVALTADLGRVACPLPVLDGFVTVLITAGPLPWLAEGVAAGAAQWPLAARIAVEHVRLTAGAVQLGAHHTLAASGYFEEHEGPWLFRRVHADLAHLRDLRDPAGEVADILIDDGQHLPPVSADADGERFRAELLALLDEHATGDPGQPFGAGTALRGCRPPGSWWRPRSRLPPPAAGPHWRHPWPASWAASWPRNSAKRSWTCSDRRPRWPSRTTVARFRPPWNTSCVSPSCT